MQPQPQLPAWALNAAVPQPCSAVPHLPAGALPPVGAQQPGVAGNLAPAIQQSLMAQAALCGIQPQPSQSSTPSDASYMGMGWWPSGLSMQHLANIMVGSQMASQLQQVSVEVAPAGHVAPAAPGAGEAVDTTARRAEGS